jgi:hypothetical protein
MIYFLKLSLAKNVENFKHYSQNHDFITLAGAKTSLDRSLEANLRRMDLSVALGFFKSPDYLHLRDFMC